MSEDPSTSDSTPPQDVQALHSLLENHTLTTEEELALAKESSLAFANILTNVNTWDFVYRYQLERLNPGRRWFSRNGDYRPPAGIKTGKVFQGFFTPSPEKAITSVQAAWVPANPNPAEFVLVPANLSWVPFNGGTHYAHYEFMTNAPKSKEGANVQWSALILVVDGQPGLLAKIIGLDIFQLE